MTNIDTCLDTLRRLIAACDTNGIPLAEKAIEEYWEATPPRARESGLQFIQQILHDRSDALSRESRDFLDSVDACFEKKQGGETVRFTCRSCGTQYEATREKRPERLSGRFDCEECSTPLCIWTGYYSLVGWHPVHPSQT